MTDINALVTDELIEKAARASFAAGAENAARECGLDHPVTWDEHLSDRDRDQVRIETRAALESAAPLIASRAWDEGFAMSELAWRHIYDGHDCAEGEMCPTCCQPNPYRALRLTDRRQR